MLVLTRKSHEQIQIGDSITITILRVKGGAIRVGIDAPRSISVFRKEAIKKAAGSAVATGESGKATAAASTARRKSAKSRLAPVHAGGKAMALATPSHENPLRPHAAAPLGRYLATVGAK